MLTKCLGRENLELLLRVAPKRICGSLLYACVYDLLLYVCKYWPNVKHFGTFPHEMNFGPSRLSHFASFQDFKECFSEVVCWSLEKCTVSTRNCDN